MIQQFKDKKVTVYSLVNIGTKVNIMLFLNDNCTTKTGIHKEIIQMLLKLVTKLSTYGQFGRPFMNYLESISLNNETIEYIEILKLFWDNKYDEVLETIERNISKLRKGSLYYLLLSIKLSALHRLKRQQEVKEIYDELRDNFGNIPRYVRGTVVESLRNIRELYYDSDENIETIRHWSEIYENNPVDKGFILMADARGKKNEGNYIEAAKLNIQAFKTLKNVPHPSGMVGALNNISWWLKDVDKNISLNFTFPLGFYASYYFDDDNYKVFNSFDTTFQVQKNNNDPMMYETAFIFSKCLSKVDKERYNILKRKCGKSINQLKYCVFNLDSNYYLNTKVLRNFLKQEIEKEQVSIKELNISKRALDNFLSGITKQIKPNTLRNIRQS